MAGEIYMPQLGLTMSEGTLVQWLKRIGDQVNSGDVIMLVETDKATQEVTTQEQGVLSTILVDEGTTVPVGTILAYLGSTVSNESKPHEQPQKAPKQASGQPEASPSGIDQHKQTLERWRSSPLARKMAAQMGVDLGMVLGRGPGGRILASDVQRYIAAKPEALAATSPKIAAPATIPLTAPPQNPKTGDGTLVELQGLRKIAAERMAYSFSTAPHFYLTVEVDAGDLVALREQALPTARRRFGVEITFSDLIIKAVAIALREHPHVNATWDGNAISQHANVNIGIAAAVGEGLIVPVIQGADQLPLVEIARQRSQLVEQARNGKLALPDLEGGTFTISNLGMFGIDLFQAIVNPPQAAILAVGRIKERPAVHQGQVAPRPMLFLSLSSDHRILDGATAARFLGRIAGLIEDPMELVLTDGLNTA
jgi:pyruvate dehydrogenase E2 component (dihydrolipoamide acetyltransferase)